MMLIILIIIKLLALKDNDIISFEIIVKKNISSKYFSTRFDACKGLYLCFLAIKQKIYMMAAPLVHRSKQSRNTKIISRANKQCHSSSSIGGLWGAILHCCVGGTLRRSRKTHATSEPGLCCSESGN